MSPSNLMILRARYGGVTSLRKLKAGQLVQLRDSKGEVTGRAWIQEIFPDDVTVGKLGPAVHCRVITEVDERECSVWVYGFDVLNIKKLLEVK